MRHTFDVTVEDQPGALARIAGMFAARCFSIDALSLVRTAEPGLLRLTCTVVGDGRVRAQVRAHLEKVVTVVRVRARTAGRRAAPGCAQDRLTA